jgi:hypothetical protein
MFGSPSSDTVYEITEPFEISSDGLGERLVEAFNVRRVKHLGSARLHITGWADVECHLGDGSIYTFTAFSSKSIAIIQGRDVIMLEINDNKIINDLFLEHASVTVRKLDDDT